MSGPSCALELFAGKFSLSLSFFLSLAIPQFGLLSYISSLRLSSGHLGLVLTLSNTAGTSLFSPCLLLAVVRIWATSPLGVAVRCVVCGFFVFPFSSQLCCPLRFKTLHRPASERVSWCLETFPPSQLPPLDGSLFSLFLSFIFCPTSFWREQVAFLGAWCPLASIQKLFCGICSVFKWSFDEFVGEKVVSLSYSSSIFWTYVLKSRHSHCEIHVHQALLEPCHSNKAEGTIECTCSIKPQWCLKCQEPMDKVLNTITLDGSWSWTQWEAVAACTWHRTIDSWAPWQVCPVHAFIRLPICCSFCLFLTGSLLISLLGWALKM